MRMQMHIYTVRLVSRVTDRNCTFDEIPEVTPTAAMEYCLRMLSTPDVWLPTQAMDEEGTVSLWHGH